MIGKYDGKIKADPKEIAGWKRVNFKEFQKDIAKTSKKYTPWLKIGLRKYLKFKQEQEKEK